MNIRDYFEADEETRKNYLENADANILAADLKDMIQEYAAKDLLQFSKDSHNMGITQMLNEIYRRLEDADYTNTGKHLIKMGFDTNKNSAQDFINAIKETLKIWK